MSAVQKCNLETCDKVAKEEFKSVALLKKNDFSSYEIKRYFCSAEHRDLIFWIA